MSEKRVWREQWPMSKNIFVLSVRWYLLHERFLRAKTVEILGTIAYLVHYVAKIQASSGFVCFFVKKVEASVWLLGQFWNKILWLLNMFMKIFEARQGQVGCRVKNSLQDQPPRSYITAKLHLLSQNNTRRFFTMNLSKAPGICC